MRRFETSAQFWTVEVLGTEVLTRSGPIGTAGQTRSTRFGTEEEAEAAAERQVVAQISAGYREIDGLRPLELSPRAMPDPALDWATEPAVSTSYQVELVAVGERKVPPVRVLRERLGLDLATCKRMVESAPTVVAEGLYEDEALAFVRALVAAGATARTDAPGQPAPPVVPDGFSCSVILVDTGPQKLAVIKAIRTITELGLMEAKVLSEAPGSVVVERVDSARAAQVAAMLEEQGAQVRIESVDVPGAFETVALVVTGTGPNKIEMVKLIREASGRGLKESLELWERVPVEIATLPRGEAESFQRRIRTAGGAARIDG